MQKTRKEGFLFGFEDNKNIEISNALLCDISSADWDDELNPNIKNMIQYFYILNLVKDNYLSRLFH